VRKGGASPAPRRPARGVANSASTVGGNGQQGYDGVGMAGLASTIGGKGEIRIVDLRQLNTRQLSGLLEEETQLWRDELHWDYRVSIELIKKFLDTHSLTGCVAMDEGHPAGYGFYVVEEHKGLLGSLFVSSRYPQAELGEKLLREIIGEMRGTPHVRRVEMQLMPFGAALAGTLAGNGFALYPRQFMLLRMGDRAMQDFAPLPTPAGLRVERWQDRHLESCAELIQFAYAQHVDGEINDQYRSRDGALKFLKNIVLLPGCGQFEAPASFVVRDTLSEKLVGVVLTSMVARGVGHTTQVCVLPGFRGRGLGKLLMQTSIAALARSHATELSLTVTSKNFEAVKLYEKLGFVTLKSFIAGVWEDWKKSN
jgi:ribosomal protein S18 acetylase RimI-like enzyme